LTGFIADLPTPFDKDLAIDWNSFERLCEHQIGSGAAAILVGETMGEAATLSRDEQELLVRAAVKVSRGRAAVIAGAGSNSTSQAIDFTMRAEASGADAVMSVVPYYNRPTQAGIVAHFRAIAASTLLPIILHDAPGRTARELSDDAIGQLAETAQFAGLRDDTGDIAHLMRLKAALPRQFKMLSGEDSTALAYLLSGGDGCISGVSNVAPEICKTLYERCRLGDLQTSRGLGSRIAAATEALSQDATPACIKYALSLLGLMAPGLRLPLVEPDRASKIMVAKAIAALCEWDPHHEAVQGRWSERHIRTPRVGGDQRQ
jgi:4-hydroxy-tetrahydrodipicolinate synthase